MNQADVSRPGSVLRAERESLGVSVREVAETLNLSITMVNAIEADDLDSLPGAVFARGYVRAYARLLELDPDPLLRHYPQAEGPLPDTDTPTEAPIWEWIRRRPLLVLGGAGGLLVSLLVVVVALLWPGAEDESVELAGARAPASGSAMTDTVERRFDDQAALTADAGLAERRAQEPVAPAPQSAAAPAADPAALPAETAQDLEATIDAAAPAVAEAADEAGAAVQRLTASGDDRLTFRFRDDCWLEVRRSDGESLYSDLSRAGSQLELVGEGPFRILLGYAPGVRLTFNGEPVPLAPHTRNNVATLVLGQ